jgi:hypothetical protein
LFSLKPAPRRPANKTYKILAGFSGAFGGAFGITAWAIELPITATIKLRSIVDIARSEGEDLENTEDAL